MYKGIYSAFIRSLCIFVNILTVCYTFIFINIKYEHSITLKQFRHNKKASIQSHTNTYFHTGTSTYLTSTVCVETLEWWTLLHRLLPWYSSSTIVLVCRKDIINHTFKTATHICFYPIQIMISLQWCLMWVYCDVTLYTAQTLASWFLFVKTAQIQQTLQSWFNLSWIYKQYLLNKDVSKQGSLFIYIKLDFNFTFFKYHGPFMFCHKKSQKLTWNFNGASFNLMALIFVGLLQGCNDLWNFLPECNCLQM